MPDDSLINRFDKFQNIWVNISKSFYRKINLGISVVFLILLIVLVYYILPLKMQDIILISSVILQVSGIVLVFMSALFIHALRMFSDREIAFMEKIHEYDLKLYEVRKNPDLSEDYKTEYERRIGNIVSRLERHYRAPAGAKIIFKDIAAISITCFFLALFSSMFSLSVESLFWLKFALAFLMLGLLQVPLALIWAGYY